MISLDLQTRLRNAALFLRGAAPAARVYQSGCNKLAGNVELNCARPSVTVELPAWVGGVRMRGLNEIIPVQDVFCSGLGAIERLEGGCLRLYFYVTQAAYDGEASQRLVVAKLVLPASAVADALLRLIAAGGSDLATTFPLAPELMH